MIAADTSTLIAYLGGGWLSENYGWRMTFVVVGLPGLLIALMLYLTVSEPKRGGAEAKATPAKLYNEASGNIQPIQGQH